MNGGLIPTGSKRRIVLVADRSRESAGAPLEWLLYHAVVEQDEIILLHIESGVAPHDSTLSAFLCRPPSVAAPLDLSASASLGGGASDNGGDEYEFLDVMSVKCSAAQPNVKVQVERVEMENKDRQAPSSRRRRCSKPTSSSSVSAGTPLPY